MLNELFQGIINTLLAVSAIILLVMLLRPLLHKFYRARVNCLIWAIIAIRLLIPALPENPPAIAIPLDREMEFFWQQEEDIGEMPQMNQEHPVQTVVGGIDNVINCFCKQRQSSRNGKIYDCARWFYRREQVFVGF